MATKNLHFILFCGVLTAGLYFPGILFAQNCNTNTDCGTNGFVGSFYCLNNNSYKNYVTYTCNNPGTAQSYCSNSVSNEIVQVCSQGCLLNGICAQSGLTVTPTSIPTPTPTPAQPQIVSTTVSISKTVRNLSSGVLSWSASVSASPGDVLAFAVMVQNGTAQPLNNATVNDLLPRQLVYNDNLKIDGSVIAGNINQNINIGSVMPGQTRVLSYQVRVAPAENFKTGTTVLQNNAKIKNEQGLVLSSVSSSITVAVPQVLGASTVSTGLTNNPFLDSFFIPLTFGLFSIWLYKKGKFNPVFAWLHESKTKSREFASQKELNKKINKIKNKER